LFRQTDMDTRFGLNLNVLDANTTPRVMNLREALAAFLDHRHDVLVRRFNHRLNKIEHRLEILAGFLIAYLNLDEVIRIIREEDDAKALMMRSFKLNDVQAEAILNMRLRQLRKLEEMEIKKENKRLSDEKTGLEALLGDEKLRWKAIAEEITETKKQFAADKRRTEIGEPPSAAPVPMEAMIEREPITVLCSEKGWIRGIKGHTADFSEAKYKEGDRARFAMLAQTTDKLVLPATNGRFYTIGCDKLPGGRGHGEPLRLMIDLTNGHDIIAMFVHQPGRRHIVASDKGRGFVAEENEVIAQTRNGKQILNLGEGEETAVVTPIEEGDDAVAVIGCCGKLLIFRLDEVPVMSRGRGVIFQRYAKDGLSDVKTMKLKDGLTWKTGRGVSAETNIDEFIGKRAQAGRLPPKGFPRTNKFS
ncbi:MAG TPA: DNA topoisomerase IV subunit A, partial [Rhodospirillales bacterium]|nr:DNA topoisomerase IV subunit A [Rhodospirillales bacterium]